MNSKKLNCRDISELLGIKEPREINGGTISKEWLQSAISNTPGCEEVDIELGKQDLLKAGIEALNGKWDDECTSTGSTITATALGRFAICLEPRLNEMRGIWKLLGKEGYPILNHSKFISTLYGYYFNLEMPLDLVSSVEEILVHIDVNHGLSDDEITVDGLPTSSAYQVIMNKLSEVDEDENNSEDDDEEVKKFVRTQVTATQIGTLVRYHDNGILNLKPPWQRGDVWPPKKKKAVIESIMLGIPLPALILHKTEVGGRTKSIEVIDGQQRLRSIVQFMENKWPLAKFPSNPRHELVSESGCYWNHPTKKSLESEWRADIEMQEVPILWFVNVKPKTLRKVFNLYNTASMKLNGAEIRNATYQTHPLHQMAFTLAGENADSESLHLDEDIQREFTSDWKEFWGGKSKRFAATELICQYFAYSRPQRSSNSSVFSGTSTANSINRLLDSKRDYTDKKISDMAKELVDSFHFAEENFDLEDGFNYSFWRNDKNGVAKFNKLAAITNMVASRMLMVLLDAGITDEDSVEDAIKTVIPSVDWPENQNAGTIWGYQAEVINKLLQHLQIRSDDINVRKLLPDLIPCMDEIRNFSND